MRSIEPVLLKQTISSEISADIRSYMEASVGIENIFKFLRLDYVWRLNYRDNPDIQTHGVRCTMRIQF